MVLLNVSDCNQPFSAGILRFKKTHPVMLQCNRVFFPLFLYFSPLPVKSYLSPSFFMERTVSDTTLLNL